MTHVDSLISLEIRFSSVNKIIASKGSLIKQCVTIIFRTSERWQREKLPFLLQIERAFHAQRRSYVDPLFSSQKERSEKEKKKREAPEYARPASPLALEGTTRVHIFSPSTHTSGRVDIAARFTMSNLSGKMHRVSLVYRRPFSRFRRARRDARRDTISHPVGALRYSVHLHLYTLAKTRNSPRQPHSHRHFGYYLPFTVVDTNSNLAPVANAQSPLTRVIERRDFPPFPPPAALPPPLPTQHYI